MSAEEWLIFYRSQLVLKRQREISQVFVDGLVGRNFARALSFYLERSDAYLRDMVEMGKYRDRFQKAAGLTATASGQSGRSSLPSSQRAMNPWRLVPGGAGMSIAPSGLKKRVPS